METDIAMRNDEGSEIGLAWKAEFEEANIGVQQLGILKSKIIHQLQLGAVSSYQTANDPVLSITLREESFQNLVLNPVEWFLFGDEPSEAKKKLLELNNPPTLCAKIFKNGEPTYSCRDCALDATCVLCMTCFGRSIHKDHNYRLSTSSGGGGGCCDCGDVEAWKQGAACEFHMAPEDGSAIEDPLKKLPKDFLTRAQYLFSILLDNCVKLVCHPNTQDLLPDLTNRISQSKSHTTVLFNDESHTFDVVITALVKSVPQCRAKLATDFATVVDREGRATIYIGTKEQCDGVRTSVQEKTNRNRAAGPLRCETLHVHLFSCQLVALRLMKWLSDLIGESDCLLRLHSIMCTTHPVTGLSHVVQALHADAKLWKVARSHTQQLFMNALLKDPDGKLKFGMEFAKNYKIIMDGFYADDQEHSISATSISVQLFTVPSLSQMLVVGNDLFEVIIGVLLEKTKIFLTDLGGPFDFQKDHDLKSNRLAWVFRDLSYVLQNRPTAWDDIMKQKFLRFLELFLSFYRRFQGMASVKRATGTHVELEPDWQRDFDLELRLVGLVPLILKWCESDRDVLLKSISLTLNCLKDIKVMTACATKQKKHRDGGKSWQVFDFDVASDSVSLHNSVVRFLAGLLSSCVVHSISLQDVLEIKKEDETLRYLDFPLKILVFVAQVKAGMWKKNGFSVRNQVRAYQNEISGEMFDRDIFLMQALATCMDKDHFLIVLLDMFKLSSWATPSFDVDKLNESSVGHQLSLAGEFLRMLIIILSERYKWHVGQVEPSSHVRREVIHRLSLGTMSRSELLHGLPVLDDEFQQNGMDKVIHSVATFKKPGLMSKGMYKLQKKYLEEFNPFFYHYNRSEQSKAEDQHRRRCKEEAIPAVLAPPVPVEFTPAFASIVDLLRCKKMIEVMVILLHRVKKSNPKSWTDEIFHEVLHLIGLALHEEGRQREKQQSFGFLDAAKKPSAHKLSLIQCLEDLQGNTIIEGHSELLRWTIKKFQDELALRDNPCHEVESHEEETRVADTKEDHDKMEKQRLAKERKTRILMQMADMQKAFIKENSELFLATSTSDDDEIMSDAPDGAIASEHPVVGLGSLRSVPVVVPGEQMTCILCQETPTTVERSDTDHPLVYSAYVQRSTLLSRAHGQIIEEGDDLDPLVSHRDHRVGVHMSSCGHVMHGHCWQRYFESLEATERLNVRLRLQPRTIDLTKREFLCPLCGGLSNTVLPLLSPKIPEQRVHGEVSWPNVFRTIDNTLTPDVLSFVETNQPTLDHSFSAILKEKLFGHFLQRPLSCDMNSMIKVFSQATFTSGLNVDPNEDDPRVSLMTWATCAYTIQCLEHSSRHETKPLMESVKKRELDVLKSLVLMANSMSSVCKREMHSHCLRLISVLPGSEKLREEKCSLVDIDLFDWMVKMCFSLPCLAFQDDFNVDTFVFQLSLAAAIVNILLSTPEEIHTDEMDECHSVDEDSAAQLADVWKKLRQLNRLRLLPASHPSPQKLLHHLQCRLLPFLRCCTILFYILNSTRVPLPLKKVFATVDKEFAAHSEFLAVPKNLAVILGWNNATKTFEDDVVTTIVTRWCLKHTFDDSSDPASFSLATNNLVELPNDYSELINQASNFTCPLISGQENRIPAKCLVCGQMLCCDAYCCKETIADQSVGPCTAHALKCGAGVGIFLRVRECMVLLLNGIGKGCLYPAPYVDEYGETDHGLRRGNPLHLCHERYDRLKKIWKQHGVASEIVRCLETDRRLMHLDWSNY